MPANPYDHDTGKIERPHDARRLEQASRNELLAEQNRILDRIAATLETLLALKRSGS